MASERGTPGGGPATEKAASALSLSSLSSSRCPRPLFFLGGEERGILRSILSVFVRLAVFVRESLPCVMPAWGAFFWKANQGSEKARAPGRIFTKYRPLSGRWKSAA